KHSEATASEHRRAAGPTAERRTNQTRPEERNERGAEPSSTARRQRASIAGPPDQPANEGPTRRGPRSGTSTEPSNQGRAPPRRAGAPDEPARPGCRVVATPGGCLGAELLEPSGSGGRAPGNSVIPPRSSASRGGGPSVQPGPRRVHGTH